MASKRIKILQVIPDLQKGGAERLVIDICNELLKRQEADVQLLNFRNINEYEFLTASIPRTVVNAHVTPSIVGKDQINLAEYLSFVKAYEPNIIHTHLFEAEIVTREQVWPPAKYISHLHGNMPQFQNLSASTLIRKEELTNYYEKRRMIKQYRKCNNNFIAVSQDTQAHFKKSLPHDLQRISLMNNAIDYEKFCNRDRAFRLSERQNKMNLVSIGSLVPNKNHGFLIQVVKELIDKQIEVHLDIIGDGPDRNNLQAKIDDYKLGSQITLRGLVDHVEDYLQKSDIYVHGAIYESFGLVLLEAMAAGLPCVALDSGGNRDLIVNGENGFMLQEQNPSLFANKLIELIEKPELYQKISKAAQEHSKCFDIVEYVDVLLKYYHNLCDTEADPF